MRLYLLCLSSVLVLFCHAQPCDTIRLYYGIGSTEPRSGLRGVDSALQAHHHESVVVSVMGYADFLGTQPANRGLAQARAEKIRQLIREKDYPNVDTIRLCEGKGEQAFPGKPSPLGDPSARRVDVLLLYAPVILKKDSTAPVAAVPEQAKQQDVKVEAAKDLADLKVGEAVAIKGINFIGGRHILVAESKAPLFALLKTLRENPGMKVEIQGHVCCTTGKQDGFDLGTGRPDLSEKRAQVVYDFLIENGISKSRLRYKGFGHARPLVWPEASEADMQANRRVEIMIISK